MSEKITVELTEEEYWAIDYALSNTVCNDRTESWLSKAQCVFHDALKASFPNGDWPDDFLLVPMTSKEAKEWDARNDDAPESSENPPW